MQQPHCAALRPTTPTDTAELKVSITCCKRAAPPDRTNPLSSPHLDEGRICQLCQPPGDLCLAATRGSTHEDVLGHHLLPHGGGQLVAAPAVAESDGDRTLRIALIITSQHEASKC